MGCTREEFFEWLNSCPCGMKIICDDFGETDVSFEYNEEGDD